MVVDVPSVREVILESASFFLCSWNNTSDNLVHFGPLLSVFLASQHIHIVPGSSLNKSMLIGNVVSRPSHLSSLLVSLLYFWNFCLSSCCLTDSSQTGINSLCGSSGLASQEHWISAKIRLLSCQLPVRI